MNILYDWFIRIKLNGYKGIKLNKQGNIKLSKFKKYLTKYRLKQNFEKNVNINTELNISNYWILVQSACHSHMLSRMWQNIMATDK